MEERMMKRYFSSLVAAASLLALITACGTTSHRIDPSGTGGLTTTHDINYKDWQIAATKCINSLLESGVLDRKNRISVIMISNVKNKTLLHINTPLLTNQIRQALLKSRKAVTTTAVSAHGAEDKATRQVRQLQDDDMFNQKTVQKDGTAIAPDYSLAGEIIQLKVKSGRSQESTFVFHMTLTDLKTGLALWEDNADVAKQETKPFIGL